MRRPSRAEKRAVERGSSGPMLCSRAMRALLGVSLLVPVVSIAAILAIAAAAAGCDAKATASDPQAAARPEERSREYESCGASLHCQDNLRCFDHVCRRAARSAVGDYHAAAGAAARAKGDPEAAILAYDQALKQYAAEKLEVPPEVDCAYGAALAAGRRKRESAELGARVLHRCVLAVPPGSPLRDQAMAQLATLAEVGLDPLALGGAKLADRYLTKAPQRPSTDKLTVSATASPATGSKSYALVSAALVDPGLKAPLVACWDAYSAAAKKDALAVTLPIKVSYIPSEYEDEPGRWRVKIDEASGLAGPEAAAEACVRGVVEPAITGLKFVDRFDTKVTITIR